MGLFAIVVGVTNSAAAEAQRSSPVPPRPSEARAAKAYSVFNTHCARCHQTGRLQRPLASGGLANLLDVDAIARDPNLVKPGIPDASRLYDILESNHAPLDVFADAPQGTGPSPEDIEDVREWLRDLPTDVGRCPSHKPILRAEVDQMMRDAQHLERDQAMDVRFISLVHLYNACASADDLGLYRQALNKLLNSLSWAAEPLKLSPLDAAGTLFSFKLSDYKWTAKQWEAITQVYPETLMRPVANDVAETAGTKIPAVNGDWLAAFAAEPPLYYQLLALPPTLSGLAQMNGVDIEHGIQTQAARRIGLRTSAVTRANRLIERHPAGRGGFWLVYDFATSTGDQDIFEHPLGPKSATNAKLPFVPDQVRAAFALPNGFFAFALFDAAGKRLDRVLPGLEKPYSGVEADAVEPTTRAGANCFTCHVEGPVGAKDEYRAAEPLDKSAPPSPSRTAALPLFGNDSENALLMLGASEHYRTAAAQADVDLSARIRGEELVSGLARRYRENAGLETAIGETGLERDSFIAQLTAATGPAAQLSRRLLHGTLPRSDLDRLFELLKGVDRATPKIVAGGFLRDEATEIGLSLWTDKPRPQHDDLVTIEAQADSSCYLTVISVDAKGVATVVFPNDFNTDNLLPAGASLSIPSADAAYQFRFKGEGPETLLARCSQRPAPPVGIEHDFEHQRFTVLGNWENFIRDTLITESEMRLDPRKAERARLAQTAADGRSPGRPAAPRPRLDTNGQRTLRDGRAVLVIGAPVL